MPTIDQTGKVPTREIDHSVRQAQRIVELEKDRVQKHEDARLHQIEIESEARVVLILKEKS